MYCIQLQWPEQISASTNLSSGADSYKTAFCTYDAEVVFLSDVELQWILNNSFLHPTPSPPCPHAPLTCLDPDFQDSAAHSGASENWTFSSGHNLQDSIKGSATCPVSEVWDYQKISTNRRQEHKVKRPLNSDDVISPRFHSDDSATSFNACRIHGHMYVNKVAGNFHITVGKYVPTISTCLKNYVNETLFYLPIQFYLFIYFNSSI